MVTEELRCGQILAVADRLDVREQLRCRPPRPCLRAAPADPDDDPVAAAVEAARSTRTSSSSQGDVRAVTRIKRAIAVTTDGTRASGQPSMASA